MHRTVVELVLTAVGAGCAVLEGCRIDGGIGRGGSGEADCEGEGGGSELHGDNCWSSC